MTHHGSPKRRRIGAYETSCHFCRRRPVDHRLGCVFGPTAASTSAAGCCASPTVYATATAACGNGTAASRVRSPLPAWSALDPRPLHEEPSPCPGALLLGAWLSAAINHRLTTSVDAN